MAKAFNVMTMRPQKEVIVATVNNDNYGWRIAGWLTGRKNSEWATGTGSRERRCCRAGVGSPVAREYLGRNAPRRNRSIVI